MMRSIARRGGPAILAATIAVLSSPSQPLAQCAFDAPTKAKGFKTSMVRAYAGCVGGITFPASNTSTMAGVPACTAPTALSEYQFGPKGTCSVQVDQRDEFPCAGSCGFACANLYVRAKCKDIRDSGGSLIQGAGWALRLIARATVGDASAGDMTLIDFFPLELAFQPPTNGALKLKTDLNSQLFDPCIGYPAPFAACATIHWKVMAIIDPSGDVFAVTGSSSR